ncbi:hypothetical protein GB937_009357 [Aspergillus fischeri]|nr:hypothetical protein GB937_009357 [Aspergillus fischeri]
MQDPGAPPDFHSYSWSPEEDQALVKRTKLNLYDFELFNTYNARTMVSNVQALIDLYDHTGPPVTYGDHFLMVEMNAAINQSGGGIDRYAYVSDLMANPRTADEALNYMDTAVDDLCTIQEAEGTAPAKRDTPAAESDNADLEERHINIVDISTDSKVNGQPTMRTILRGIRNGDLTLHYARWEHFNDRNGDGSREGPLLEIAYWIGSEIGTLGANANEYQETDNDKWVVFHFHYNNDGLLFRPKKGQMYIGCTSITVFHGQTLDNGARGDNRIWNRDDGRDGNPNTGNTRSRALQCPRGQRWYIAQAAAPSAAGNHYYATELAEFARTLYDQGYLGAQAFRLIYPGSDNPFEFHTSQYQQFGDGMSRNFLMVEREIMAGWTEKNDLATARHLLNRNVSPDEPYSDPPLSVAIRHQRLDIVQLLYEHNVKGFMGEFNATEIHVAARVGNLAILEFIWNKLKPRHQHDGFLHRADLDGMTPLHDAAASGSLDCVRFLLREGADVNSCPEHGMTPLHYAAKRPNAREIIEVLVQAGAQVDAAASNGESALFGAVESDDKDAVAALLRAGASVTLRNQYNETVLHTAAYSSSLSLLQTLVDAGADMTARSTSNSTILHRAAEAGRVETVAWILQHTHLPADDANSYGWTPLHFAAAKNHLSTVKFLVEECGADISALPSFPRNASALHLATHCFGEDPIPRANCTRPVADNTSLISYLLAHGADVWARADDGILMGGYESGENIFRELHECTSGPESEDDCDTVTPLDCAAAIGSIPKAQALLAAGADINARSRTGMGWTALLHAVTTLPPHSPGGPITPIIRFLIQNGADVRIVDTKGRSVVHYLCYYLRATEPVREFLVETGVYKEDLEAALDLKVIPGLMRDLIYRNQS